MVQSVGSTSLIQIVFNSDFQGSASNFTQVTSGGILLGALLFFRDSTAIPTSSSVDGSNSASVRTEVFRKAAQIPHPKQQQRYGLNDQLIAVSFSAGSTYFFVLQNAQTGAGTLTDSWSTGTGGSFPRGSRSPMRDDNHSPASSD